MPKNSTLLVQDDKGHPIVSQWMLPHALSQVCDEIHKEMEDTKPSLQMKMSKVSLKFLEEWDIEKIMGPVAHNTTPTLSLVLDAAIESKASHSKPKTVKSKNQCTASLIIMTQPHFLCSKFSAKVQIGLGLQAWACDTLRQMIHMDLSCRILL